MRYFSQAVLIAIFLAVFTHSLHLHDASESYISYLQSQQNTLNGKLDALSQKLS